MGFTEDGLASAVRVAKLWQVERWPRQGDILYPVLMLGKLPMRVKSQWSIAFAYRTFSIKVDVDCIEQEESQQLRWLSLNRFNLLSLNYNDDGARDGTPWRQWLDGFLAQDGIDRPARAELMCYPRVLGYSFNPLSMWYA